MAPLAGLTGISGQDTPAQVTDEGVLEAHSIGAIDPGHAQYGSDVNESWPAAYGLGYQGSQYGVDVSQGQVPYYDQPGRPLDSTPSTHQAPYPRGIIQPNLEQPGSYAETATDLAIQRDELHSQDLGGPGVTNRNSQTGKEIPSHYTTDRYDAPNQTMQAPIPGQIASTFGTGRDTGPGGYGQLNSTDEFQRGHSIRRVQHDGMPWDRSLDYAPPQPFWGREIIQEATFDGPDSPYGQVMGDTSTGQQVVWEGRIGNPTSYVQPPEPAINQAPSYTGGDVWAYG